VKVAECAVVESVVGAAQLINVSVMGYLQQVCTVSKGSESTPAVVLQSVGSSIETATSSACSATREQIDGSRAEPAIEVVVEPSTESQPPYPARSWPLKMIVESSTRQSHRIRWRLRAAVVLPMSAMDVPPVRRKDGPCESHFRHSVNVVSGPPLYQQELFKSSRTHPKPRSCGQCEVVQVLARCATSVLAPLGRRTSSRTAQLFSRNQEVAHRPWFQFRSSRLSYAVTERYAARELQN
jgi:hypothetical protein